MTEIEEQIERQGAQEVPAPGADLSNPLTVAVATAMGTDDNVVLANAAGGAFTVTLPSAADPLRKPPYIVKRLNAGANVVTVGSASGSIDGGATYALTTQYARVTVISDGTNWHIIAT